MLPIAVDAMGGDKAPGEIVAGAVRAVDELGVPVVLVGRPEEIGETADLEVIVASEVIPMDADAGKSVRRMKDSSLVRAAEAVRDGKASAMVSAGNTGATMASALFRMGRIKGEFAQMGAVYAKDRFGIDSPRVGLLSIGEEETKGNALVKDTHNLLATGDWVGSTGATFVGNVEGRDIMSDAADVVVTDGFTGNVTLKTLEGGMKALVAALLGAFETNEQTKAAAATLLPALGPLYESLDPERTGGAMLLGVDGICIISHGSSSATAIVNAVRVASELVASDVVAHLRDAIAGA
ncbi:MAG: phosphate acyltransferase [Actinobacteria bacterium]|nr:phosphate acyltransferase [Actinomycetota bacterium]